MPASIFREISAAWPIAIKRSKTSNLAVGAPGNWENDFFVKLSKKEPWEKILREIQKDLPKTDPTEINEVFSYTLSKLFEADLNDERERIWLKDNIFIELEKFIPLDDEENELVNKAKALLQSSGAESAVEGAEYEIDDLSGTDCGDPAIIRRTLNALEDCEKGNKGALFLGDKIPCGSLTAADISIIRSAAGNGRFEAAWNLSVARYYYSNFSQLRNEGASCWVPKVLVMLKNHPVAVEKERRRLTTRLFVKQNCEKLFPSCSKFFSTCVSLRIERAERAYKINHLAYSYRCHFEKDLQLLDAALGISERSVMKIGYVLWLKEEYYNRIQEAEIEELGAWIKNNKEAVSLAVAEILIQTHPDMKKFLQDVYKVVEEIVPVGEVEKCLLEDAHTSFTGAKSEVEQKDGLIVKKINFDPAPAA